MEPCNEDESSEELLETLISRPIKGPKRKTYCNADKLKIIAYGEKHGNLAAVKKFRVNYDSLRSWIRRRAQIMVSDPLKYTNRGCKRKSSIQPGKFLKSNLIESKLSVNESQEEEDIESEPNNKNLELLCFICCAAQPGQERASESVANVGDDALKKDSGCRNSDTLSVVKILMDMFSIRLEESTIVMRSSNISFCASCIKLITKWGAVLKEIMDLQSLMERYFSQMDNLKKGIEEMFEEFNTGSLNEKLRKPNDSLKKKAGIIESDGNIVHIQPQSLLEIKLEPLDAEIEESVHSNGLSNLINGSSPEGLRTRGQLRKLPIMHYNEEHSDSSEVCSDGHIRNDSPVLPDREGSSDKNEALEQVEAGGVKDLGIKRKYKNGEQLDFQTGIKSLKRKRRSFVVVETESDDSNDSKCRDGASVVTESDSDRGGRSKVSKKRRTINSSAPEGKKRGGFTKQKHTHYPREELDLDLPGEMLTLTRKRDLKLIEFPDGRIFMRFIEVFRVDDKFKCSLCGENIFHTLNELRGHVVETHSDVLEQHKGKRCVGPRKTQRNVMKPKSGVMPPVEIIRVGDKVQCSICKGKLYNSTSSLRTHMRFIHYGVKTFECTLCGMKLPGRGRLNTHMKSHVPAKTAICEICGRSFKTEFSLSNHKRSLHSQNGGKKFPCQYCGKEFIFKRDCMIHTMSHTGEKPYQCELCAETFKVRALLSRHLRSAHGQDPRYACSKCGEMFSNPGLLHTHVGIYHQNAESQAHQNSSSTIESGSENVSISQALHDSQLNNPSPHLLQSLGFEPLLPLE